MRIEVNACLLRLQRESMRFDSLIELNFSRIHLWFKFRSWIQHKL